MTTPANKVEGLVVKDFPPEILGDFVGDFVVAFHEHDGEYRRTAGNIDNQGVIGSPLRQLLLGFLAGILI